MNKTLIATCIAAIVAATAGCSTTRGVEEQQAYYNAQLQFQQTRGPLFELVAQPGETIELKGVAALRINNPDNTNLAALPDKQPHPAWGALYRLIDVAIPVAGQGFMARESRKQWTGITNAISGQERSDNSTNISVGGNYGDTDNGQWANSGRIGNENASVNIGGDNTYNSGRFSSPNSTADNSTRDNRATSTSTTNNTTLPEAP